MLWSDLSDDDDEQPEELRRAQTMLRRGALVIAIMAPVIMLLASWRG
ncbi:hypothetical protein NGB36_16655 [Streptomyces sp. RB6PN25]|uniref:Uncharacterized protein n=1 Tax=Streptomyces humicola TaxID=2953240 RepID=A0ABT1PYJ3_9ACTN|nr:hypothetical protein [Streptomyces humicola]MCQ4082193.1 hypothetical protein [Streptomyces humicola]